MPTYDRYYTIRITTKTYNSTVASVANIAVLLYSSTSQQELPNVLTSTVTSFASHLGSYKNQSLFAGAGYAHAITLAFPHCKMFFVLLA